MQIGLIGLGKMGGNMSRRLTENGHTVVGFDPNQAARDTAREYGVQTVASRDELVSHLEKVIIWLMIPSEYVDKELEQLLAIVPAGAIIIDGGNSDFRLTKQRAELCKSHSVTLVDVGTSGGILGYKQGYAMMIGGEQAAVESLHPIFETLAPKDGWAWFGQPGSGHYVKMVHNAIEYGAMQAYTEGYRLLKEGPYADIDLASAGNVWQHGSIIQSLLNDVAQQALAENPKLEGIDGYVHESGEAKWALEVADEHHVQMPVILESLKVRKDSQNGNINFATKLLAAMRNKFGGHAINKEQ